MPRFLARWSLLRSVSLLMAGCVVLIGAAPAHVLPGQVRDRLVAESERRAAQVTLEVNSGALGGQPLGEALTPETRDMLDRVLARLQVGRWVEDVKVWNPQRRILYTQDREVLGQIRPISDPLRQALGGRQTTNFGRVHAEGGGEGLFEVYTPLRGADGRVLGALEVYLSYAPVAAAIRRETRDAVVVLATGLLALYLLLLDRKSTRLNSSHANISYAVFCLKKKKKQS